MNNLKGYMPYTLKDLLVYRRIMVNEGVILVVLICLLCISCGRQSVSDSEAGHDNSITSLEEAVRLLKADAEDPGAAAYINAQWQTGLDTPELFCRYFQLMYEPQIEFRQIYEVGRPAVITLGNGIRDRPDFHFRHPKSLPYHFESDVGILLDDKWVDYLRFSDGGAKGGGVHDVSRFFNEAAMGVHSLRLHVRVRMYGSLKELRAGMPLWESEWSGPRHWFSVVEELPEGYLPAKTNSDLDAEMNKRLFTTAFQIALPDGQPDGGLHYGILAEGKLPIELGHSVWASVNGQTEEEVSSFLPLHYGHNDFYRRMNIFIAGESTPRRDVSVVFAIDEPSLPDWLGLKGRGGSSTVKFLLKPSLSSAVQNTSAVEYWGGVFTGKVMSVPFK